ncbi:UNKNOWN [Stylonychia lemnae]|uniref:Uncharacterized protein n=1 Tax=Stylonychia lemnae TaxID=5949 RepID=A0A078ABJ3_STYLE|nr:UNKNOWN [Stylonychia lemnae]|eukprot:CDW79554.1 UNKNOWN [Stylonychia lemnae]
MKQLYEQDIDALDKKKALAMIRYVENLNSHIIKPTKLIPQIKKVQRVRKGQEENDGQKRQLYHTKERPRTTKRT